MRKQLTNSLICTVWMLISFMNLAIAQISTNTVKYKVTYSATTQTYTAWVVPDYNVPNTNNTSSTEKGGTAQFTIVVPKDFVITEITDIKGTWSKPTDSGFTKLGPGNAGQTWSGLNPALNYYVIGKTPSETEYGSFSSGTAVALFSFKGNGCFGPISPLAASDAFIAAADNTYSLNVANSFYSRSGQSSGGNVIPSEQFVNTTGGAANCSISANPDTQTVGMGATTLPVLSNDKTGDGATATLTNVTPPTVTTLPTKGTVTVNADGTLSYTPTAGSSGSDMFVYQICDKGNPTVCDTAKVMITLQTAGPSSADLKITKTVVGSKVRAINDLVTYTVVVKNAGPDEATNIVVQDSVSSGLELMSGVPSEGTYNASIWNIPSIVSGDSAVLTVTAKVSSEGISFNFASIKETNQIDPNLTNNEASACVTVPIKICTGQGVVVSVPSNYTGVVWQDQNGIVPSTGNSITLTQAGVYTFTASNGACPAGGCCPVIIENSTECCPVNVCVPFTVVKRKIK